MVTTSEELPRINNTAFQIMGPALTVRLWPILSKQRMLFERTLCWKVGRKKSKVWVLRREHE